jgi:hypothetical protein
MPGPDSRLLAVMLILVSAALLAGVIRLALLPVKILCGALSIVVAMTGGVAVVNLYYGYYTSWGQLWADFNGGPGNLGVISATRPSKPSSGRLGWTNLPGRLSGDSRSALVYLPRSTASGSTRTCGSRWWSCSTAAPARHWPGIPRSTSAGWRTPCWPGTWSGRWCW